jgi:hypothetical protein
MRKDRIFFVINEINEALSLSNHHKQILNLVLNVLTRVMGVDASWVHLADTGTRQEVLTTSRGLTIAQNEALLAPALRSVLEDRIGTGDLMIIPDLSRDEKLSASTFVAAGFGSLVAVPLLTTRMKGILGTMWRVTKSFDADYGFLLLIIGSLVGSALERADIYEQLLGQVEPEPGTRYEIEEFEKLVALAEQYSRATRLAMNEAVVRARGEECPGLQPLVPPVTAELLPVELPGRGDGETGLPPEAAAEAGDPARSETASGPAAVDIKSPEVSETPGAAGLSDSHERRMKDFARLHAGNTRIG